MQQRIAIPLLMPILLGLALTMVSGCRRDFSTEADALREQVMMLERDIEQLERRNAELESELRRVARQAEAASPDALVASPRVTAISIGRFSNFRDTAGDGVPDTLRVYVHPVDGYGNFVPLVGTLSVHAAILPEDAEAITVARRTLHPEEVRESYRSGFTGTHYTVVLSLDWPEAVDAAAFTADERRIHVEVTYEDGLTGERFAAERGIRWRDQPARERRRPSR